MHCLYGGYNLHRFSDALGLVIKWCDSNEVDFWSPSVNQIADFLLHLFKESKLQPSTIEGYRTAIADMVGNNKLNISKDENLFVRPFS